MSVRPLIVPARSPLRAVLSVLARSAAVCGIATFGSGLRAGQIPEGSTTTRPEERVLQVLRKDLEYLAGPETEGRGVGTAGGKKAIDYVAARFRAMGLDTVRCEGVPGYLQTVKVEDRSPRSTTSDSALVFEREDGPVALAFGTDVLPFRGSGSGHAFAPVVFVGYGLVAPELGRDDYAGLDVRGKVVLVLRGVPRGEAADSRPLDHKFATYAAKFAAAERAGAVAVLLCNRSEEGAAESPEARDEITLAGRAQGETPLPALWLKRASARKLFGGRGASLADRQALVDAGKAGGLGVVPGVSVRIDLGFEPGRPPRLTANVIGVLPGCDPALRSEFIVVGAHHDHLGRGEYGSLGGPAAVGLVHPGADDNASGVVTLLEVARHLVATGGLARSVIFVAFGAGEAGMFGSRAFLEHCPVPRESLVAMLNLDSVGRAAHKPVRIEGVGSGLGFGELFRRAARSVGLEVQLQDEIGMRSDRSDHIAFLARRIPVAWFTTGVHEQYRRPTDVAGLVDVAALAKVAEAVSRAVRELGTKVARPEFVGEGLTTRRR